MNDGEKKAIERAEFLIRIDTYLEKEMLSNLLNLIQKQQKEIEELKEQHKIQKGLYETYGISKDKIKAKIEELEKEQKENQEALHEAIVLLRDTENEKISNKIIENLSIRETLKELLEEEGNNEN